MILEVWPIRANYWGCHIRSGGNITFTASGYDSKSIAVTALCNHMIACHAFIGDTKVKDMHLAEKQQIRAMVRARVKVLV